MGDLLNPSKEGELSSAASKDGALCLQSRDEEGCIMNYAMVNADDASEASLVCKRVKSNQQLAISNLEKEEFSRLVQKFLEARYKTGLPVLLGGEEVDLFNLNVQVKATGGYDAAHFKWSSIAENLGFAPECGLGLRLVYVKYLKALDGWRKSTVKEDRNGLQSHLSPKKVNLLMTEDAVITQSTSCEFRKTLRRMTHEADAESFVKQVEKQPINDGGLFQDSSVPHPDVASCDTVSKRTRRGSRVHLMSRDAENKISNSCKCKKTLRRMSQDGDVGISLKEVEWEPTNEENSQIFPEPHNDKESCETTLKRRKLGPRMHLNSASGHSTEDVIKATCVPTVKGNESLTGLLDWIKRMALNPGDPRRGQGPRGSKQNGIWVEACLERASRIRALLWKKKESVPVYTSWEPSLCLTTQKLPPSLYYQELPKPEKQVLERLRVTQNRVAKYGFHFLCAKVGPTVNTSQSIGSVQSDKLMPELPSAFLTAMNEVSYLGDLLARGRKRIPIGPDFQAAVPPCTNPPRLKPFQTGSKACQASLTCSIHTVDPESDRWLGSVVWPLPGCKSLVNKERVGKGRPLRCLCIHPGSINCVKLHVQVKREKLRLELGQAFDSMGLNDMGEAVSDSWSPREELSFREIVKMNLISDDKNFWSELRAVFPSKSMEKLVTYYFNVFVLRRRAIQNRLMPGSIDSDDDEVDLPEKEPDLYRTSGYGKFKAQMLEDKVDLGKSAVQNDIPMEKFGLVQMKELGLTFKEEDNVSQLILASYPSTQLGSI